MRERPARPAQPRSAGGEESGGTEESGGGDEDSKTLSIIALVVGGLGLVMGGFALNSARKRP